ncbi:TIGR03943 family putative permease subunit [Gloeocapsopsis dulcis]|uniref:TIGR03943 family protein n=1 Tax=Gloeocapsopsis dulcis AAB1 = 1H9 TaxID=1433147 RepID=A0A6N8FSV2_9CHRO|nr:TIGR03943 family protein [Gloeocapsopsis dulcis]MUL36210.1 TIGR03943 family protein [Gloeocapsopsis dulcis AAB1 = 1H9]WNN89679.1 TIGR03943 family protein [Gloeocapsopsis dulcis]
MHKSLQLLQDFAKQVTKISLAETSIDVWKYAESAHEEPNPYKRNILQWRRLISSVKDPLKTFPGEPIDLIGFVQHTINSPEQFILARHIIRCCLADTVPLGLPVYTPNAAMFPPNSWLRVKGCFGVQIQTKPTLVIVPQKIKSISEPKKIYINGVF